MDKSFSKNLQSEIEKIVTMSRNVPVVFVRFFLFFFLYTSFSCRKRDRPLTHLPKGEKEKKEKN